MTDQTPDFVTAAQVRADLEKLGLHAGDAVMVHSAMGKIGPFLNGPDDLIHGLLNAVAPENSNLKGVLLAYTDWEMPFQHLLGEKGGIKDKWRDHIHPFNAQTSRAARYVGAFPEFVRSFPGAFRSANPGASVAAIGPHADWFTAGHPLDYGYGQNSPFGKLVQANGKVAMLGAPFDTMTLLHHAEQLADLDNKRIYRYEAPLLRDNKITWHQFTEFNTGIPVVEWLSEEYFGLLVSDFIKSNHSKSTRTGKVGHADSLIVSAPEIVEFAVQWLENHPANPARRVT